MRIRKHLLMWQEFNFDWWFFGWCRFHGNGFVLLQNSHLISIWFLPTCLRGFVSLFKTAVWLLRPRLDGFYDYNRASACDEVELLSVTFSCLSFQRADAFNPYPFPSSMALIIHQSLPSLNSFTDACRQILKAYIPQLCAVSISKVNCQRVRADLCLCVLQ